MKPIKTFLLVAVMLLLADFAFAQTWTQTSAPIRAWTSVASSADGIKLIAVAGSTPIYTSTNSGGTWASNSTPSLAWNSVASSADGTKLITVVSSDHPAVLVSTNSGISWLTNSVTGMPGATVTTSMDGSKLFLLTDGAFYISTNSGTIWTHITHVGKLNQNSPIACSADGTKLGVAFSSDGIYTSTNSGDNWKSNNAGAPFPDWSSIASSADGSRLVAGIGGNGGPIYISTDFGATWITNAPRQVWTAMASSADGSKLIAASNNNGTIYTSTNSGVTWISNNVPTLFWRSVASSADGNKLVAAASNGGIYTLQTIPTPRLNLAFSGAGLALSWIVPSTNFVVQQSSDLTAWADVTNPPVLNLTNLQNEVTLTPSNSSGFYRLKMP
jgi:hypothetical protein